MMAMRRFIDADLLIHGQIAPAYRRAAGLSGKFQTDFGARDKCCSIRTSFFYYFCLLV
jgi:hypothetical protein